MAYSAGEERAAHLAREAIELFDSGHREVCFLFFFLFFTPTRFFFFFFFFVGQVVVLIVLLRRHPETSAKLSLSHRTTRKSLPPF